MKANLIALILAVIPLVSKSQSFAGDTSEIKKILNNISLFSEFVMAADIESIGNAYTEDAKIFVNNRDIIEGRELIKKYWTPGEGFKTTYHKIYPEEIVIKGGDTAYDYGRYEGKTLTPKGEEVGWKGKYVIVWKKVEDDWKIYLDIWNRTE